MIYKSIKIDLKLCNWSSVGVLLASSNSMFHQEIHWNVLNNNKFDQVTMGKEYEELDVGTLLAASSGSQQPTTR